MHGSLCAGARRCCAVAVPAAQLLDAGQERALWEAVLARLTRAGSRTKQRSLSTLAR